MLNKEQSSLVVKIVAAIIGLAFIGSLFYGLVPSSENSESSQDTGNDELRSYSLRVQELEKVLKEDPNQANVLYELGGVYYQWGEALMNANKADEAFDKFDEASKALLKSMEIKPNVNIQALMGNISFDWGMGQKIAGKKEESKAKFQEAINYYEKYLEADPKNTEVRTDMGICYFETGEADTAISHFNEVLKIDPKHVQALYNLGLVSYQSGKNDEAKKAWNKYLEIEPSGANADFVKDRLKEMESKQ